VPSPTQSTDRPTDLCSFDCPDTRSILLLDPRGLLPLNYSEFLTPFRHSSSATAARRPGPLRPRPNPQLRAAPTDLCRHLLPSSLWLLPGCDRGRQLRLATPRQHRHKTLGQNGTWRPDSVLAALGFSSSLEIFPYRMYGFDHSY
jgi:hypothetical protein